MNCCVRLRVVTPLLFAAAGFVIPPLPAAEPDESLQLNGHTFTLPAGFQIELVAGPPLVERPISAAFDEHGRLYVSDSSGSNDKVEKQLEDKPHRIVRLEDTDGDGRFDRSIVFADRMMFPEGTMWFDGSLYVAAPPPIWKLSDTDGDGVADRREEWFAGKTLGHCANDLHGPYLGPDGMIYWCKGAFAKQTYERVGKSLRVIKEGETAGEQRDGVPGAESSKPQGETTGTGATRTPPPATQTPTTPTWSTRASHIFRCRPDGSGLEVVMTGGMDNPVDVVFTPGGERIFSTTFLVHPGGGRRDGLLHAVYGGIYGKDWDVIHDPQHKWTGPGVMPVLTHHGAAASCGLHRYESRAFGPEYENNLFACLFNMHKVTRHVLEPDGATFNTRDEDFLVSSNLDFHPTDVLEDADGSLLVIDTGGWYKLCCPTSQLHKPDITGAVYRIRRRDAARIDDPRGLRLAWSSMNSPELANLLADERPAVRNRAIHELAKQRSEAVAALSRTISPRASSALLAGKVVHFPEATAELHAAIGALTRMDHSDARAAVRALLSHHNDTVRQAAIHSVSLWRDRTAVPQLIQLLRNKSAQNRRAAAEALGRIGETSAVPSLLAATTFVAPTSGGSPDARPEGGTSHDRFLEHSLIYALIEIGDPVATASGLESINPSTRRAALMALSEMDGGGLNAQTVAPLLESTDPAIREAAVWVAGRHPDWGGALAGHLSERLAVPDQSDTDRAELQQQLARFARNGAIQELLAATVQQPSLSPAARCTALRAMRDSGLKEKQLPPAWIAALLHALAAGDPATVHAAVAAARALPVPKDRAPELAAALESVGQNRDLPVPLRLDALAGVPGGLAAVQPPLLEFLCANLTPDSPVAGRSAAADVLAKAKLRADQLDALTNSLNIVGPMELDRLLAAFEQSADEAVGLKLIARLKESPALAAVRADTLTRSLAKCGPAVHEQAQELYAAINVDMTKQRERLEELLASIQGGDIRRGQAVFMGTKAACSTCHQFGYLGGNVGPDLTRIGSIRNERDLLESIVFPSSSFVRSYESVLVATPDGRVHNGILKRDAPDEIVLATTATETVRIARDEIDELRPGTVSVMPSGLDQQLTPQELADVIAFLKAAK